MNAPTSLGKTALVTGASGGIGFELAKLFARDGYNLVLVARGEDKLNAVKSGLEEKFGISARVIAMDLSNPSAPDDISRQLQEGGVPVHTLVNNAGFTVFGPFAENEWRKEQELLQVNIVALTHLTKLFLPGMVERGEGRVLNVASTAAFMPGPLMAAYYASKAYVLSFSEAVAEELRGTGVTVTALCPGITATGFQKRGEMEGSRLIESGRMMDAKTVARAGYGAMMKGQPMVVPGASNRLLVEALRLAPRRVIARGVKKAQERV